MSTKKIDDNVFIVIGGEFPLCNSLVVISDEILVVDPGCGFEQLRRFLRNKDLEPRDIDAVVITHIHPDHITHVSKIHRLSGCRIAANKITAPLFNEKEAMKRFLGFHPEQPVRRSWEELVNNRMFGALDEGRVDEELDDGDKITLDDVTLRVVYTPGHLPDHMCIELVEPDLIFGADIDCTPFGPFYGHPNCSISDFKTSIRMLQERQYSGLISGHLEEPLLTDYITRLHEYYQHFTMREDMVFTEIVNGAETIDRIISRPIIYPALLNPVYMQFEKWMIEHHIESLIRSGKVIRERGRIRHVE